MANSQNGWPAITTSGDTRLAVFPWVTGRVLAGDVSTVFDYLARRFHDEVESIDVASSWGWAYRPISGSDDLSNHASGTAIDLNAPRHPLGASGTFSAAQVAAIHAIVAALSPAVRWGGDYAGRKDEMHFEINTTPAGVAQVASRIRGNTNPQPSEEDKMLTIARTNASAQVWVGDGVTRRRISTGEELADLQWRIQVGHLRGNAALQYVDRLEWLGRAI